MSQYKLPTTDSIQELAEFWQSHDLADYESELEEVTEPVFEREDEVRVKLSAKEAEALRALAQSSGVEPSELIRDWVIERVQPLP